MKKHLQRHGVGQNVIAPPFRMKLTFASLLLLAGFFTLWSPKPLHAQLNNAAVSELKLQFQSGTADFDNLEFAKMVSSELISRFEDSTITVLLVRIRTQKAEFVGKEDRQLLQIARANAIKSLFLPNGALERDQLQVHSSIEYNNDPAMVTFELYREDGSLVAIVPETNVDQAFARR
ncbi:MAG: hypothetical protein RLZZ519_2444 [Bacteroidota bacterium]|jgi:hypothetical protein